MCITKLWKKIKYSGSSTTEKTLYVLKFMLNYKSRVITEAELKIEFNGTYLEIKEILKDFRDFLSYEAIPPNKKTTQKRWYYRVNNYSKLQDKANDLNSLVNDRTHKMLSTLFTILSIFITLMAFGVTGTNYVVNSQISHQSLNLAELPYKSSILITHIDTQDLTKVNLCYSNIGGIDALEIKTYFEGIDRTALVYSEPILTAKNTTCTYLNLTPLGGINHAYLECRNCNPQNVTVLS